MKPFDDGIKIFLKQYQAAVLGQQSWRTRVAKKKTFYRLLNPQRRVAAVAKVVTMLTEWKTSPFQFEGAAIAGLRSSFCLSGHSWGAANSEAESIVAEALRLIGAERPAWAEGQREYTEADGNCYNCGGALDDDATDGRRKTKFCSAECAKAQMMRWGGRDWNTYCEIYAAAHRTINRSKSPVRQCEECRKDYRAERDTYQQRYCSASCYHKGMLKLPASIKKVCVVCDEPMLAKTSKAKYCSKRCESKQSRLNYIARQKASVRGGKVSIYLTPELYGLMFSQTQGEEATAVC